MRSYPFKVDRVIEFCRDFEVGVVIPRDIDLAVACLATYHIQNPGPRSKPAQTELILSKVASDSKLVALVMWLCDQSADLHPDDADVLLAIDVLTKVKNDALWSGSGIDVMSTY